MYKYYLFDLDGVLADTTMIQYESTREAILTIKNIDILKDDFWNSIFLSTITTYDKLYRLYESKLLSYEEIDIIYNEKKKIADSKFEMLQEDEHKMKLFHSLKQNGCKIAVVTNGNKISSEIISGFKAYSNISSYTQGGVLLPSIVRQNIYKGNKYLL